MQHANLYNAEYRRRRDAGYPGWNDEGAVAEYLALLEQVFETSYFPRSGRLLELGCGAGDFSLWAAKRGYEVHGIDISPFAIQWAVEKAARSRLSADFQVGNVLDLSCFDPASFHPVLDGHCFHCIVGMDRARCLEEVLRVLAPGGVFHVNTMCGDPSCEEHWRQFDVRTRCLFHNGMAVRYLGLLADIEKELTEAGFNIVGKRIIPRWHSKEMDLLLLDAMHSVMPEKSRAT